MKALLLASSILAMVGTAQAASITVSTGPNSKGVLSNYVTIKGDIVEGDYQRFLRATLNLRTAFVVLESNGGLMEGLAIGEVVRERKYSTVIYTKCASVCGFIWLAGTDRFIASNGHVGFHGVYFESSKEVSSGGNAVLGAYLSKLGLSLSAIRYLTSAKPYEMEWLTREKAQQYGIDAYTISQPQ
jgi:hypothetical protein